MCGRPLLYDEADSVVLILLCEHLFGFAKNLCLRCCRLSCRRWSAHNLERDEPLRQEARSIWGRFDCRALR